MSMKKIVGAVLLLVALLWGGYFDERP